MGHGTRSQERRCGLKKHSPEAAEQHHDRLQEPEHPEGPLSSPVVVHCCPKHAQEELHTDTVIIHYYQKMIIIISGDEHVNCG